jgi:hypothetical protein
VRSTSARVEADGGGSFVTAVEAPSGLNRAAKALRFEIGITVITVWDDDQVSGGEEHRAGCAAAGDA